MGASVSGSGQWRPPGPWGTPGPLGAVRAQLPGHGARLPGQSQGRPRLQPGSPWYLPEREDSGWRPDRPGGRLAGLGSRGTRRAQPPPAQPMPQPVEPTPGLLGPWKP